jgi:hypothetical protein
MLYDLSPRAGFNRLDESRVTPSVPWILPVWWAATRSGGDTTPAHGPDMAERLLPSDCQEELQEHGDKPGQSAIT